MLYFFIAFIFGCCGWVVAGNKNREKPWWFILCFFFPLFLLLLLCMEKVDNVPPAKMKKCPFCAEKILFDAVVCKHCKKDLTVSPVFDSHPGQGKTIN